MKTIAIAVLCGLFAACSTPSRAPVATQAASKSDGVHQSYLKSGYQVVHRNGQVLYCRSERVTGTLLRSTVCETDAEMQAAEQSRQNVVDELGQSHGGVCQIIKCH